MDSAFYEEGAHIIRFLHIVYFWIHTEKDYDIYKVQT